MANDIIRNVDIEAPVERVWQALSDHRQFGAWFGVALDGPFVPGEEAVGRITHPGYEHVRWAARIVAMEAPHRFVFTWHPYAVDPAVDYAGEEPTTVEFRLAPRGAGTRLTVTESGFDKIPADRREQALRMNGEGWSAQVENVRAHVEG
jgi:uncharacterized protein YndB with AHSA1/START domain